MKFVSNCQYDNEIKALCKNLHDVECVCGFYDNTEFMEYLNLNDIDFVVIDYDVNLIKSIYKDFMNTKIVCIVSSDSGFLITNKMVSAYLLYPIEENALKEIFSLLGNFPESRKRIFVRTFGRLDVFVDGEIMKFVSAKAKELFALLVDRRGGLVTMEQAIDILWPFKEYDKNVKTLYRKAVMNLRKTLKLYGCLELVNVQRGALSLNTKLLSCDYYSLFKGVNKNKINFNGEYMFDYSWADGTLLKIEKFLKKLS